MRYNLWGAVTLAALVGARPMPGASYEVHEKRDNPSHAWIKRNRVAPHAVLPMKIGLAQQNLDQGYKHLVDV